jgi:AcrR family transcriptional regulator
MPPPTALRKDAQRNREAILTAAREMFAQSGDVPMYEIAKRAGVGQATLYRNFPDRGAIISAIFAEVLDHIEGVAAEHAEDPDAFFVILQSIAESQAYFHALIDCLNQDGNRTSRLEEPRKRLTNLLRRPLRDAKAAGTLRRDLTTDDVLLVLIMIDGALTSSTNRRRQATAAARALTLVLDGLRPGAVTGS